MKEKKFNFVLVIVMALLLIPGAAGFVSAQDDNAAQPPSPENLPFVDRDGDGINDLLQNGLGLRFLQRRETMLVDTDGDGKGDTPLGKILREKMNTMIDTDRDGTPDTTLRDYLRTRYQTFDNNGDGLPDPPTRDEIKVQMQAMQDWRDEMKARIEQGLEPFFDENGDGIPDNLPPMLHWRMRGRFKHDE